MALNPRQIQELIRLVGVTREGELNCQECLEHVAEYLESDLSGQPLPEALKSVEIHLDLCVECREEYQALRNALLKASQENDSQ